MKACSILLLGMSIFWTGVSFGQSIAPAVVQWQKVYGGDTTDARPCLAPTSDGGFILAGQSLSDVSGNKSTPNYGDFDFWVVRVDAQGNKVWEGSFGGGQGDRLWAVQQTSDGGYILAGESISGRSGNKSDPGILNDDFWVVRLDANGHKLWDKAFGGGWVDKGRSIIQTPDGGFLVAGTSASGVNGNKTTPSLGYEDFWVVRLDAQGQKLWERAYGGLQEDYLTDARQTSDGGFILAGYSNSAEGGTKTTTNYGGSDLWMVRIDSEGNELWEKNYGGTAEEQEPRIIQTTDGGFLVGASTMSDVSGNKSSPFYGGLAYGDYWVLRLDSQGDKLWEQDFGGTRIEVLSDVVQTLDGGFVVAGFSSSEADGNKTAPRRAYADAWLVRLDAAGNRIWDQTYTGLTSVAWPRLCATRDGGIMMAAQQGAPTEPQDQDLTLIKLSADALTAPQLRFPVVNPGGEFRFELSGISNRTYVTEFSADMVSWWPLATNQLTSRSLEVLDAAAGRSQRFYRARMVE